jgi:hypothetical protein
MTAAFAAGRTLHKDPRHAGNETKQRPDFRNGKRLIPCCAVIPALG